VNDYEQHFIVRMLVAGFIADGKLGIDDLI
jgi:hypothetical protein